MIQALPKTKSVTFEEFVEWKPEGKYYELHHGVIIEMAQPLGDHEDITGFLAERATAEYLRLNLPYRILKTVLVKPPENQSAYSPDVLIINRPNLINEPLWKQQSTLIQGASIPLVIEVVSTNWRVDYLTKVKDYEEIGIPEYWIVDYLALGGTPYIGNPKQPTISIYDLINGEYQVSQFRGNQTIVSRTFPELTLTANQIFQAGM
ncbi:MAG: Uma2 family endonuclease [Dolichospermum sp.]|jgi:Uma2 family endonuclease|uniref:Uma2 family endonuclease n=1 Tax=Dolichospermum sp. FACHB-1091 TaxID=2692798 RepID=UPI0016808E4A|nr:Uma2 family endonuclease [Dolichospermum sp. FACHB-1091]MBD1214708.1 Uma2 family endonuclease [Dolichospermum circinale Clear-D4]MBD2442121.1 Uma2 family endonuclease [Dolichospermum sp. FACHB-1091]MCE2717959.1 Uma2 family endonuclease [Anabaena sp. 49628_E55]